MDVGIASADAVGAGWDLAESMVMRKTKNYYAQHSNALDRQNIVYQLVARTCYGRPHLTTTSTLCNLSRRAARRRGYIAGEWRLQQMQARFACLILPRAARMVRACWRIRDPGCAGAEDGGLVIDDGDATVGGFPHSPPGGLWRDSVCRDVVERLLHGRRALSTLCEATLSLAPTSVGCPRCGAMQ